MFTWKLIATFFMDNNFSLVKLDEPEDHSKWRYKKEWPHFLPCRKRNKENEVQIASIALFSYDELRWFANRRTTWWGLNLIEKKSSRIAESGFEYLRVCSFKVQSQWNPKTEPLWEKSRNIFCFISSIFL